MPNHQHLYILRYFLLYISLFLSLIACDSAEKKAVITPFTFPEDTAVIYRINDKDNFLSVIANNSFWKQHNPHSFRLHEVKILNTLPTDENLWVAFSADDHFFAVTPHITNDSLSIWKKANDKVQKQAQFGKEWFYTLQGDYLIIGDTDKVGSYAHPKDKPLTTRQQDLEALQKLSNNECAASIFLSQAGANTYFRSFFGTDVLPNNNNWVTFDLFLEENNVRFSGISLIDKENNTSDCMLRTQPYQNTLIDHLPARVLKLTAYSFDDADLISLPDSLAQQSPFLTSVNGIAFAQTLDGYFAVASTYNVDDALQQLPILSEDFQYNFAMYDLNPELPLSFFKAFAPDFAPRYVGVYQRNLIFTPTRELLISVVNDMQRGNTLSYNKAYQQLAQHSASNVTLSRIANLYDQSSFSLQYPYIAEHYRWALFQQTPQNDYYVLNFVCEHQPEGNLTDEMRERFRFALDDQMVIPPTLLLNHRTKQLEIAVQDANNDLYLIGNNGSLLWKKHLDGKIQSPIYQVDLFKNGFLQMAFSTEKTVWVLDRNGKEVEPFPRKYKGQLTPLEVFDYNADREYRFLFAENQTLHLLDRKGQVVKGFFQRTNGKPLYTPKHFRIADRDYLIYAADNGIFNILHRNGENRITVRDRYTFSDNPPAVWNGLFMFTTNDGYAVFIDEKGGIRKEKKNLEAPFYWGGNKYLLYALSGNILTVGTKKIELLNGKYERPRLFRIGGTNYVSVNDLSTQKAYLYNDKGNLIKDFPVESVSPIAIDVDLDKTVWIVTEKSPTEIVVFSVRKLEN